MYFPPEDRPQPQRRFILAYKSGEQEVSAEKYCRVERFAKLSDKGFRSTPEGFTSKDVTGKIVLA